jgi:hypothetical protein
MEEADSCPTDWGWVLGRMVAVGLPPRWRSARSLRPQPGLGRERRHGETRLYCLHDDTTALPLPLPRNGCRRRRLLSSDMPVRGAGGTSREPREQREPPTNAARSQDRSSRRHQTPSRRLRVARWTVEKRILGRTQHTLLFSRGGV